jgi:acetyl-CoA C-acetyltransferase
VKPGRDGVRTGIVARAGDDLLALLNSADEPVGERVYARSFAFGNRVTTTRARASRLNSSA